MWGSIPQQAAVVLNAVADVISHPKQAAFLLNAFNAAVSPPKQATTVKPAAKKKQSPSNSLAKQSINAAKLIATVKKTKIAKGQF